MAGIEYGDILPQRHPLGIGKRNVINGNSHRPKYSFENVIRPEKGGLGKAPFLERYEGV